MSTSTSSGAPATCNKPLKCRYNFPAFAPAPRALNPFRFAIVLLAILALAPQPAAAERKVLRFAFRTAETGFDPQRIDDRYSVGVCENLFEGLLTYDYLARPVKLVPLVAESIPQPEEGGTRYTFRIRPGILYADDPAFKGRKRELVAKDFEYAIKRFRDPANRSPYEWLFENKLVGLDELAERAKKTGKFDYEAKIAGIEVRDNYTVSFKLQDPDFNFLYVLAMPNVVPGGARGDRGLRQRHARAPRGHRPLRAAGMGAALQDRARAQPRTTAATSSTSRYADPADEWDRRAIEALAGKRLPLLDRVEIYPIEDEQPRFLAFLNREHDIIDETPFAFIHQVLPAGKLAPRAGEAGRAGVPGIAARDSPTTRST